MFPNLPPALRPAGIQIHHLSLDAQRYVQDDAEPRASDLPDGAAAAIGSFDGVHTGHQQVIATAVAAAKANGKPSAVICFEPHPQGLFHPEGKPFRLMDLSQQLRAFAALGVDYAYVLDFDRRMSQLTAEDFARLILAEQLRLSHVSAGFDFRFGQRGQGQAEDLTEFGRRFGYTTDILPCQTDDAGNKLSSSAVREALLAGDVSRATQILGRPQAYLGEVIHGAKQGRTIDFPTLNLKLGSYLRPRYGIYVTRTRFGDGRVVNGVSNIGVRPTVGGDIELLETYLFDFAEEVYGQVVETELLHFIRPEARFASFDELKTAIADDAAKARAFFIESASPAA
ncbi:MULTISPECIES: riboflavin biosynthesis protein RibF [Asticcacaulis]|uniref:riboflavin biosynthesis protein RibF n=1 Tax=Asticcacaulis TaxID=76890 RepID=UPI001AE215FF|nr:MULTISPECIES: riboflavin biosynthesis protein RibF [Asticcacaulis]MBP2160660.1 riboflavin kinase/FMN adenylyltransferase [Asticcacaulis solisilvae]MDR6801705.1 riboflavin kinase/FMN adenylyltransferase [Asticcacaulis sp. BE141]